MSENANIYILIAKYFFIIFLKNSNYLANHIEVLESTEPRSTNKDDTLPCKRQALAWQKEPKAWTQAFQALKFFFMIFCSLQLKLLLCNAF